MRACVELKDRAIHPSSLTIERGTTVTFRAAGTLNHVLSAEGFESPLLRPGDTWSHELADTGTCRFRCEILTFLRGSIEVIGPPDEPDEEEVLLDDVLDAGAGPGADEAAGPAPAERLRAWVDSPARSPAAADAALWIDSPEASESDGGAEEAGAACALQTGAKGGHRGAWEEIQTSYRSLRAGGRSIQSIQTDQYCN